MTVRLGLYRCDSCGWEGVIHEFNRGPDSHNLNLVCPLCTSQDVFRKEAEAEAQVNYTN